MCCFVRGFSYVTELDVTEKKIILRIADSGSRIVSGRKRGEAEIPIIDLRNADITSHLLTVMGGPVRVRLYFSPGKIEISAHEVERNKTEREERIKTHLKDDKVAVGRLIKKALSVKTIEREPFQAPSPVQLALFNAYRMGKDASYDKRSGFRHR